MASNNDQSIKNINKESRLFTPIVDIVSFVQTILRIQKKKKNFIKMCRKWMQ